MKTIFCPNHDSSNESINKEVRFLNELGVETLDFSDFKKKPWKLSALSFVNLNWYDDINETNRLRAIQIAIKKVLTISLLRLLNVKIIYTLHNKVAHDGKSPKENMFLKKYIMRRADIIALLSKKSKEYAIELIGNKYVKNNFFYVGHPAYCSDINVNYSPKGVVTFLYYGMVRPYKNIELLIEAWKEADLYNANLVIAGKPINESYGKNIIETAKEIKNIKLILRYIKNDELDNLINDSTYIICPLDKKSSMNSGTLVKAFCMKKCIIIPDIEMTYDYDLDSMFVYSYTSYEDHKEKLKEKIKQALQLYNDNPEKVVQMGEKLYSDFMAMNSDEVYKNRYKEMYFGKI